MESSVPDEFYCIVCSKIMLKPVLHKSCGSSICDECLNKMLIEDVNAVCPVCRGLFLSDTLMQNTDLENRIQNTYIPCKCGAQLFATQYDSHIETCQTHLNFLSTAIQSVKQPSTGAVNRSTFKCPCCSIANLTQEALIKHFKQTHGKVQGVCPICASMPWGDPNYISSDLGGHLSFRHKYDVSTYTEFGQGDDEILNAVLKQSMQER